jgi:hypothetical protein
MRASDILASVNICSFLLVFLPDGCVSVALRIVEYATAPLPCPPAKILRNLTANIYAREYSLRSQALKSGLFALALGTRVAA